MKDYLDAFAMFIIVVVFFMGLALGAGLNTNGVNQDCRNYGKYATDKYMLTCEAKK